MLQLKGAQWASKRAEKALEGAGRILKAAGRVSKAVRHPSKADGGLRQQGGYSAGQRMKVAID